MLSRSPLATRSVYACTRRSMAASRGWRAMQTCSRLRPERPPRSGTRPELAPAERHGCFLGRCRAWAPSWSSRSATAAPTLASVSRRWGRGRRHSHRPSPAHRAARSSRALQLLRRRRSGRRRSRRAIAGGCCHRHSNGRGVRRRRSRRPVRFRSPARQGANVVTATCTDEPKRSAVRRRQHRNAPLLRPQRLEVAERSRRCSHRGRSPCASWCCRRTTRLWRARARLRALQQLCGDIGANSVDEREARRRALAHHRQVATADLTTGNGRVERCARALTKRAIYFFSDNGPDRRRGEVRRTRTAEEVGDVGMANHAAILPARFSSRTRRSTMQPWWGTPGGRGGGRDGEGALHAAAAMEAAVEGQRARCRQRDLHTGLLTGVEFHIGFGFVDGERVFDLAVVLERDLDLRTGLGLDERR